MERSKKRLLGLVAVLPILVLLAALVYMVGMAELEGEPRGFWQAIGWSAETLSTTGYGSDTTWRHPVMVVFVVVLQFIGVFLVFLIFPLYLIPFLEERFEVRLPKQVPPMDDHVVIYGYGAPVETLLAELARAGLETVVVEGDEGMARRMVEKGQQVVYGGLVDDALERARLENARTLIANGTDDENAAVILAARQLGFGGEVLALVEDPFHRKPIMLAGATAAFTPRHILGAALAARASRQVSPTVAGAQQLSARLRVAEVRISQRSSLVGQTLAEAGVGQRTGVSVIAQWVGGQLRTRVRGDMRFEPNGIVVLIGSDEAISRFGELCHATRPLRDQGPFVVAGAGDHERSLVAQRPGGVAELAEAADRLVAADQYDNAVGLEPHVAAHPGPQLAAHPLGDHRHPGALADTGLGQGLADQRAALRDSHLGHPQPGAQLLGPGHGRADLARGPRRQGGAQDVPRREGGGGARQHDRLSVERVLDQRQHLAAEAQLTRGQDHRRVLVVGAVGDQGAGVLEPCALQGVVDQATVDHLLALLHHAPSHALVALDDHCLESGPRQLGQQRLHRRAVAVDDHVVVHRRHLLGQPHLEPLFQKRNQVEGEDQKDQKDADELQHDDEDHHHRMAPGGVAAVPGGRQRLRRPADRLPEAAWLALQLGHAHHVDQRRQQHQDGQHGDEAEQAFFRSLHGVARRGLLSSH